MCPGVLFSTLCFSFLLLPPLGRCHLGQSARSSSKCKMQFLDAFQGTDSMTLTVCSLIYVFNPILIAIIFIIRDIFRRFGCGSGNKELGRWCIG